MSNFPWDDVKPSHAPGDFSVHLIDEDSNPAARRIFWGKGYGLNPALVVDYPSECRVDGELPAFENIHIVDDRKTHRLVVELLDAEMRDVFLRLCLDITTALQDVPDIAIRKACLLRLERWSSFLRPARSKMSPEAQKGLIAELHFLQRDALAVHSESSAIEGWTGPERGPRDFVYGQVFVELKSKRSSANPSIVVSSENQLNVNQTETLYLCVSELNSAPKESSEGFSITDVVNDVRRVIQSPLQLVSLDKKLAKVGYFDEDDYSDTRWSEGETYYYAVLDGFPKIDSQSCSPGVSKVTYQVDLDYCEEYLVDREQVISAMR